MSQLDRLKEDLIVALKKHDSERLGVLRLLKNSLDAKAKGGTDIEDVVFISVTQSEVKKRQDAIALYEKAGATDKAAREQTEIDYLKEYLPHSLPAEEIEKLVQAAISQTQATSISDMGKVMAALKDSLAGRADMGTVSAMVREQLV